ncbi:MAG TPA: DUF805 domain-containing protein [Nocardioides sp.]|nr:DUF805 domain-containing protein [Nocardioides sp.]
MTCGLLPGPRLGPIGAGPDGPHALALFLPSLAVGVRRLHDTDRSGWWILIGLIPIIGWILLIVWFCTDSKPDNQYGPNPKTGPSGAAGDYPPPAYGSGQY